MLHVYCDGSITGSHWGKKNEKNTPAFGWTGWVVQTPEGVVLHHSSEALGTDETMSANVSEYTAVKHALRWLIVNDHRLHALKVFSDSQLVMFQLSGKYNCHVPRLLVLRDHVRKLAALFPQVTYNWIPREQNRYADFLTKSLHNGGAVPQVPVPAEILARHR